jgi:Lrp/AsnC family transcriptional regulator, leucine-responsive regulatory protein
MTRHRVDAIDLRLLELLQLDGRTSRSDLAERVELSVPAVSERMKKLEELGILRGYHAILDPEKVGLGVGAFIFVTAESSRHFDDIVARAVRHENILECHAVTGAGSHLFKARTNTTAELEKLLNEIQSWPGVTNTRTSIILSSPKEDAALPLKNLALTP